MRRTRSRWVWAVLVSAVGSVATRRVKAQTAGVAPPIEIDEDFATDPTLNGWVLQGATVHVARSYAGMLLESEDGASPPPGGAAAISGPASEDETSQTP